MIFFIPSYDEATDANLSIGYKVATSNPVAQAAPITLFREAATPEALVEKLKSSRAPLFVMSHGRPDSVMTSRTNKENEEIALSVNHCAFLTEKTVFAFACHTATFLGEVVAQHGGVWFGYTGPISAPDTDSQCYEDFVAIFRFIAISVPLLSTLEEREQFWQKLHQLCEGAKRKVSTRYFGKKTNKIFGMLSALFQIWDRLRIWIPGASRPEMHPRATLPILQPLRTK